MTMFRLCYAYLAGSIALFSVWLAFFVVRKDLRNEMLTMSLLIGVLAVVTGYIWWTVDWWKPPTMTHTIIGVEDLVMGFAAGGIMASAYEVLFRRRIYHARSKRLNAPHQYGILVLLALLTAWLFWGMGLTSFWASTIALLAGAGVLFALRPDLLPIGLLSGGLMAVISLLFYFTIIWVSPGWVHHTYQFRTLSGVLVFGIPIEEFVFWFLAGMLMGPFYEYWHCERFRKSWVRHALQTRPLSTAG
jgi:hypothetical protein